MRNNVIKLLTEFVLVFLGVLLAFLTSNWAERKRDEKYVKAIFDNLIQDVRNDSSQVIEAISSLKMQHDSLQILIDHLGSMNLEKADRHIYWTYFSYNVFDPTTKSFESMVFGGDMKLVNDLNAVRRMKELDHLNKKLGEIHEKYYLAIESFRNSFICHYNMDQFTFESIPREKRIEFWNRVNFLKANVKYYYEALVLAQTKYNSLLKELES
ncbi:DUF6090 family protein [Chryseolinea sp. H1M3-3]|uniref:DUF6090 family protein n=1 Tax=Chryseolinea sp. H1M3-3 TaxID=3034144 RepID=UPI0023EDFE92|nr:DUF6090 family protein [Chryseolinea sp. H1M3-3]